MNKLIGIFTLGLAALAATPAAEARPRGGDGCSRRYVEYSRSCGGPAYVETYISYYDDCGRPVYRTRVIPVYREPVRYQAVRPCPPPPRPCPPPVIVRDRGPRITVQFGDGGYRGDYYR